MNGKEIHHTNAEIDIRASERAWGVVLLGCSVELVRSFVSILLARRRTVATAGACCVLPLTLIIKLADDKRAARTCRPASSLLTSPWTSGLVNQLK